MADKTEIIPPRVSFIDERTGLIAREWYRFLLSLFSDSGDLQTQVQALEMQTAFMPDDPGAAEQAAEAAARWAVLGDVYTGAADRDLVDVRNLVATLAEEDASDARRAAQDAQIIGWLA